MNTRKEAAESLKKRLGIFQKNFPLGENLAGGKALRRFYTLDPTRVAIAVPVRSPTRIQFQGAKKAKTEALRRERFRFMMMISKGQGD